MQPRQLRRRLPSEPLGIGSGAELGRAAVDVIYDQVEDVSGESLHVTIDRSPRRNNPNI